MTETERLYFQKYVIEVFRYEHQCSTEILARVLLLCELLIEKGLITDAEVAEKLATPNVEEIIAESNYDDDTWKPEENIND